MVSKLDFLLNTEGELSYRMSSLFHGALIEMLPEEYAAFLHQSQLHPYSQHLERVGRDWHWIISMLDDDASSMIGGKLREKKEVLLRKHDLRIGLSDPVEMTLSDEEMNSLFYRETPQKTFVLQFKTPTAFKRQGRYLFYPDLFCFFQSLMMRHDSIYDRGFLDLDALEDLVSHSEIVRYDLRSTLFSLEGVQVNSFLGRTAIRVRGPQTMVNFANMLLRFGEYSGVGIKTAIGMGAYSIEQSFDRTGRGERRMTDRQAKLIIGSLLHDIGKLVYRSGDGQNHSQSGYRFLKEDAGVVDQDILNCVRYHHGSWLKGADLSDDALAYITYFADNVAAAADRREDDSQEPGFDRSVPLSSVFNILNGHHGSAHYERSVLDFSKGINYPTEKEIRLDDSFYQDLVRNIKENLKGISYTEAYINSLLSILEAYTTYVPSSTARGELADISFYDHVKMTAALAACIEQALSRDASYRKELFLDAKESYGKNWFLLFSIDVSGIQKFIYSVGSKGALRCLRARSFYLELMMEHIIDELLARLSLSRANLIYVGGGHSYILLPNTAAAKETAEVWMDEVNQWLLQTFQTDLFVAYGFAPCSARNLKNEPKGSYSDLFRQMSSGISAQKVHRYSADRILYLNRRNESGDRECRICRRLKPLNAEDICGLCSALEYASGDILY